MIRFIQVQEVVFFECYHAGKQKLYIKECFCDELFTENFTKSGNM